MFPGGCKSRVVGCGPACWSSPHTVCTAGRCSCLPGYLQSHLTSSPSNSLVCSPASSNSTLHQADQAAKPVNDINIHYYPGEAGGRGCLSQKSIKVTKSTHLVTFSEIGILNYWMFAMITIACIFIVFVGVSIYILW